MAARFWVGGGSSTAWSATTNTNWALTSGGANNVAVPTVSDDVTFNGVGASSNGASVVSASISCLSLTFAAGYTNTVTINTGVVLTIAGNFTDVTNHSWVVSGTGSLSLTATSTIASGSKTFPGPVTFSGASATKTLNGNWTITGTLTITANVQIINRTTAETLTCAGLAIATVASSGTCEIILSGGTWSGGAALSNNLTFAGNVTVSGSVVFNTGTIKYTSGTITTTSSTLSISTTSTTFDTNGMSWNNISISSSITITLSSLLTITGTLTVSASGGTFTWSGTAGFTAATCSFTTTSAQTMNFVNGVTYTITTAFNAFNSRTGSIFLITSDHASNTAAIILNNGATCNVLASFTRINASGGRTIFTFNGVLTTTTNITAITDLTFVTGRAMVIQGMSNF